ncbi:MAG: stage V sporulation protein AC [Oscillospiraceae bacterium]|nr:stage V sporulation protein AC [Oscillospiraceae bacterium]
MKITNNEYNKMLKAASPKTELHKTLPKAFIFGGLICVIGEAFLHLYMNYGASKETAAMLTSITLIGLAAILTGFKVYDKLAKHAGAGTIVPITGFANAVVAPALEFKTEGFILGVGAKMFVIAGPVIVYGIAASVLYGLIYYIMGTVVA